MPATITIRPATSDDLEAINQVISDALMTWQLPERVKRLSMPSYHYDALDLQHYHILLASLDDSIVGVMALDHGNEDIDRAHSKLLIHGLFVDPAHQHQGTGTQLFRHAELIAQQQSFSGILVRAHKDAGGFFSAMGMTRLAVTDTRRDYAERYWKASS